MTDPAFPVPSPSPDYSRRADGRNPVFWRILLSVTAVFVLLYQLGGRGLNEPDEGRFAEAGREMAASGDYLTPHLNGVPHLAKPPLTYWLIALSLKTWGVNDFGARFPAALAAMGTLLAVYLIGRRAAGEVCGLWAAAVLLSSILFLGVARLITTDMLLTCWVTWSVWALWRWSDSENQSWQHAIWFYVFLGLGMITKGPVAVVLPVFALAGMRWRNSELRLRRMGWIRGLLVILAIALPWFVAVAWGKPEVWRYFLGRETAGRLLSNVHGRSEPWWYFFPVLAGGMFPWTQWLALAPAVRRSLSDREARLLRMGVVWAGAGLLLFTLSHSKLATYALPLTPPLALVIALTLTRLPQAVTPERLQKLSGVCGFISAIFLAGTGVALAVIGPSRYHLSRGLTLLPLVAVLLTVPPALLLLLKRKLWQGVGMLVAATLTIFLTIFTLVPHAERWLGTKGPANYLVDRIRREDPQRHGAILVCGKLPLSLPFYLQQTVLWYRPTVETSGTPGSPAFEYTTAPSDEQNIIETPEQLRALLTGKKPVYCIAASKEEADRLAHDFKLQELDRDNNRVLFVAPAPAGSPESSSATNPPAEATGSATQ